MIPKIIWQTYKDDFNKIPVQAQRCANTWKKQNRGYKYNYFNDKEAASLILKDFGQEWHDLFVNVPVGVVRGDIFRYLMIYKYGGVYSDIDTICQIPASEWISGPIDSKGSYNAIFAVELLKGDSQKPYRICQWTFAAVPGLDIFKNIIDRVKIQLETIDWSSVTDINTAVHFVSGPDIFSLSILEEIGFAKEIDGHLVPDKSVDLLNNVSLINNSYYAKENKIFIYGDKHSGLFNRRAVKHMYAGSSENWNDGTYVQWKKQTIN
jgi:hypothetical protein